MPSRGQLASGRGNLRLERTMSRSVDLCDRYLSLAGLRSVDLNGWSGVVQVISSVSVSSDSRPHVSSTQAGGCPVGLAAALRMAACRPNQNAAYLSKRRLD